MAMILVFMALGMALFYLVRGASLGTELERKDLRSFNVAEAGVDAGMLALKTTWPEKPGDPRTVVDTAGLRSQFPAAQFRDSTNLGGLSAAPFIDVLIYDNSTVPSTDPTYTAHPDWFTRLEDGTIHPNWDRSTDDTRLMPLDGSPRPDGRMVVDSRSSVDNDRQRILIQAQRAIWPLSIPYVAMAAASAGANGQGLQIAVDPGQTGPLPAPAYYSQPTGKGVVCNTGIVANPNVPGPFSSYASPALLMALRSIAQSRGSFFTDANTAANFLFDTTKSPGAVVYVDLTALGSGTVTMAGNTQVGTPQNPTILVLKGQGGLLIDWRGTNDFYGVVIVDGSAMNRGTAEFHGSILCSGSLTGKGNGSADVLYNGDIIARLNGGYTINVSIVPNTWVELKPTPLTTTTTH